MFEFLFLRKKKIIIRGSNFTLLRKVKFSNIFMALFGIHLEPFQLTLKLLNIAKKSLFYIDNRVCSSVGIGQGILFSHLNCPIARKSVFLNFGLPFRIRVRNKPNISKLCNLNYQFAKIITPGKRRLGADTKRRIARTDEISEL